MFSLKKSKNSDLHTSTISENDAANIKTADTTESTTSATGSQGDLYDVIFPLLRASLWGEDKFPFTAPPNTDWDAVYEELCHQTVQHLSVDILCREDPKNRQKYILNATRAVRNWHKIMQAQQDLYELFQKEEIPFVILKGAAADCYYPKPEYRCMGDIDLIVKPEDFERAYEVMLKNGYKLINEENDRHTEWDMHGVRFEVHRFFAYLNDLNHSNTLDNYLYSAIEDFQNTCLDTFTFPKYPEFENGLVLLEHINQHLESGLGLRQIIDWTLYVDKELDDSFWNNEFSKKIQGIGLEKLAIAVTRMSQIYLGLHDDITWCKKCDSDLCQSLIEYIIAVGNFGKKISRDSKSVINSLSAASNISTLLARLQYRGRLNWKVLEKCPWLEPFAWLFQICRYIRHGFARKSPIKQFYHDAKQSYAQDTLLEQLGVTRMKKGIATSDGKKY